MFEKTGMKTMLIAIQPDNYGPNDASSPIWSRLLRENRHEVREVDVRRADILEQLRGCDGFMWRYGHHASMKQIAKRLLPVVEQQLGLLVYPDQNSCWHYDDKISQAYLLSAAGIPTPKTWVWYDQLSALTWAESSTYPLVIKLYSGAGGANVELVESFAEAKRWIDLLFDFGLENFSSAKLTLKSRFKAMKNVFLNGVQTPLWDWHRGYVLFQEFLADNHFDTRITVIGDKAFGFRRFNRINDFRASGSGNIDWEPTAISESFVRLAFDVATHLGTQSCAIDGLLRNGQSVVAEISYTYASWAVQSCPGHWDRELNWHEGQMWPEEAQIEDFLQKLKSHAINED
jgi:glutathione synthase/RimK-type ligase-like ATP-grasp enzyme